MPTPEQEAARLCRDALSNYAAKRTSGEELSRIVTQQTKDLPRSMSSAEALERARDDAITILKDVAAGNTDAIQSATDAISRWEQEATALSI